jgi:hypothetical protein
MEKVRNIQLYGIKYYSFLRKSFNSRVFYMFGIIVVFVGIALENIMIKASFALSDSPTGKVFPMIPLSVLFFLTGGFLIVMKRRGADFSAIGFLFLSLLFHRPAAWVESFNEERGLMWKISEAPFNYFFYFACVFLIVFLIVQIKKNKYRIKFK